MVSTPNFVLPELAKQNEFPRELVLGNKTIPFSGNLNNDVASLNGTRWNWQQLLRAVEAHQREPKPNRIHLVGSKGEGGSYDWLKICNLLLKVYFPDACINEYPYPVDFEDLENIQKVIQQIIRDEVERGVPEQEIIVDATGGQKTTSIAVALATLNSKVTFQYVQTTDSPGVIVYDVISEAPRLFTD